MVYVLESTLLSQDDGSDETRVILGIFSSIEIGRAHV